MALSGNYFLVDPHPRRHIVYPYTDEERAVNAVYLFASSGLAKSESVILIMADFHADPITSRLGRGGLPVEALQADGQLECISADVTLQELTANGPLDETLFREWIRRIVTRARKNSPSGRVRIFGEIVSLLLIRNEIAVAEQVEMLWNEAVETHDVSLFCSYALMQSGYRILPDSLAKLHTHGVTAAAAGSEIEEKSAAAKS